MADRCRCDEIAGVVTRNAPEGWERAHDCDYVRRRNALIPRAEQLIDGGLSGRDLVEWRSSGARVAMFMETMDKLVREAGIIKSPVVN